MTSVFRTKPVLFASFYVALTALFTGAVLAQQIYIGTGRFNAESTVPTIVVFGITRELGPVIASLMAIARARHHEASSRSGYESGGLMVL